MNKPFPAQPADVINASQVLKACQDNAALARTMLQRFLRILPTEQAALEQAYQAGDWESLCSRAHRLRSGSLYLGAERIGAAAQALEEQILASVPHAEVTAAWEALCQACQSLLAQPEENLLGLF